MRSLFRRAQGAPELSVQVFPQATVAGPGISGIAANVRIATDFGPVPAMLLRPRDRVQTADGGYSVVDKIGTLSFEEDFLTDNPKAQGILIRAGALGGGIPRADIIVAPQQWIGADPKRMGAEFAMAENCLGIPGVSRLAPSGDLTFHQLALSGPAVILAEGVRIQV